ncbi:ABC transporter ATP-binding protein [Microbacterium sp. NC79]|uniref:ABC transporter ATP-binding protein n=1 Tax=Microbacterium sp. NC79 TaxID=2851009 RepID=UPI001C2C3E0E|nr:ABC transporter ATP-binding protein [Microbacterium sp. NC79]MBV0893981.1 ABC transporter ATP-binding protein [Microbacterium sp. NC79]
MSAQPSTASNSLLSASTTSTRVEFDQITKDYGTNRVLHDLDLDIAPGEFVSLLGPSGCGKTTALRVLSGLETATSGRVLLGDRDVTGVPTNKRDIGMVFQSYSLFPHLKVVENTAFGLRRRGVGKSAAAKRAHDALDLVGLASFADRYPHQLSGGQQQRVALARALVTEPRVLLLDEPLSALDAKVRVQLRDEIRRLQLRLGMTTVFVTHDQEEALAISDRIAVMNAGRIEQIGTPEELYGQPISPFVAAFVGLSSVVPGVASGNTVEIWGTTLPLTTPLSGDVEVPLRPEHVRLAEPAGAVTRGTVQESTFLGSFRRTVVLTDSGHRIAVQHDAAVKPQFGDVVGLELTGAAVTAQLPR